MIVSSTPKPPDEGRKASKRTSEQRNAFGRDDINERADIDDVERSRRRSVMTSGSINLRGENTPSKDTMMPHIKLCQQLFDKNKIDSKNVWSFKIIDYLSSIVRTNVFQGDTFKMVTSAMEVGVKVYDLRVDSVHEKTKQMVSTLTQGENQDIEDDDLDNTLGTEGQLNGAVKRPRTRRVFESNMIADPSTFTAPIKQLVSTNFNIQGGTSISCKNYLSRNVPMDHNTNFQFMSNTKYFEPDDDDPTNLAVDEAIVPTELPEPNNCELCPTFQNYDMLGSTDDSMRIDPGASACEWVDHNGELIVELDGSICETAADGAGTIISEEEVVAPQLGTHHVEYISDVIVPTMDNDYSYLPFTSTENPALMQVWAGPSHWKYKPIKHIHKATFTGKKEQHTAKKRTKHAKVIQRPVFSEEEIKVEVFERRKPRKNKAGRYRIPPQLVAVDFKPNDLMRKNTACSFRKNDLNSSLNNGHSASQDEFTATAETSHHIGNDMDLSNANMTNHTMQNQSLLLNNSSIQIPESTQLKIDYAKTAKKIDMKKLKSCLWEFVCPTQGNNAQEITDKSLSSIYPRLWCSVDNKMKEALSPALAFNALLHLANEKELMLSSDIKDVYISKAKK